MAERFKAAVLKTVDCNRSGGSNPSLSATMPTPQLAIGQTILPQTPRHRSSFRTAAWVGFRSQYDPCEGAKSFRICLAKIQTPFVRVILSIAMRMTFSALIS